MIRSRVVSSFAAVAVALGLVAVGPASVASAGTASISGAVSLGSASTPAGAGDVRVYYSTNGITVDEAQSTLTDAAGSYSFPALDAGQYYLFFDYLGAAGYSDTWWQQVASFTRGYQSLSVPTHSSAVTATAQVLGAPGSIAGTVTLAGTATLPTSGEVLVSYAPKSGHLTVGTESTPIPVAAGGAYVLPNLPNGQYVVHFTYAGTGSFQSVWAGGSYELNINATITVNSGTTTTFNQAQPKLITLTGQLSIGDTVPAEGLFRMDFEHRVAGVWSSVDTLVTGANGAYTLPGLLNVPHRATITYLGTDGHAVPTTTIPEAASIFSVFGQSLGYGWSPSITEAVNIGGTVYLGDNSVTAGAGEVAVEYRLGGTLVKSAVTNASGEFLIGQLPVLSRITSDMYDVTINYLGTGNYPNRQWRDKPTDDDLDQYLVLNSTASLAGHVTLGAAGVSAGAGEVVVRIGAHETVTDASGNYSIVGMNNGWYKVQFIYGGSGLYTGAWWPNAPFAEYASSVFVDGSGTILDMQLPDGGSISGRVTTPAGAAVPYATVTAVSYIPGVSVGDPDLRLEEVATANANGEYSFPYLRADDYTLEFTRWSNGWFSQMWGGSAIAPDGHSVSVTGGVALTNMDVVMGGAHITGSATCPSCGTSDFLFVGSAVYTVEVLDPSTGEWVTLEDDYLDRPNAGFSYTARYPGTYRVGASYSYVMGSWGSGYSEPFVVAGADLTTMVAMQQSDTSRIGGQDRFDVSAAISQAGFEPGVPVVYIADGMNYPDALSAAPAAARGGGPLLLVTTSVIPVAIAAEIQRLAPDMIVVVGGPGSVSPAVYGQLAAMAPEIHRLGGQDRYEASRSVAEFAWGGTGAHTAYISTGNNFPDALSAGGAASMRDAPVITIDGSASRIDDATRQLLIDLGVTNVRIAGGPASVSTGIATSVDALPGVSVTRLSGLDRYEASGAINRDAFDSADTVFLSVGTKYPDALSGGALAGLWDAPLYVIPGDCIPRYVLEDIREWTPERVIILGGPGSVQPRVLDFAACLP